MDNRLVDCMHFGLNEKRLRQICALFFGVMILLVVLSAGIMCAVPPVSRDALTHHLAVPKLYLQHGGIYQIPHIEFSYYPMNLDLLYMLPLAFGNDIIPKYMHFAFALFTALLIYRHVRRRLSLGYACFAVLFFLSLPVILKLSITAYVDLGLVFFSTAALLLLIQWAEAGFAMRYLVYAGACCGLAMGTKYNGMITFFLLSLAIPVIYLRYANSLTRQLPTHHQLKGVGHGVLFALLALLLFSPWMLRNYAWTGNPVFPLYRSHFPSTTAATAPAILKSGYVSKVKGHFAIRKHVYQEPWYQIALIPLRIFFQGKDDDPKFFDGRLNPLLLVLSVFAFIGISSDSRKLRFEKKLLLYFAGLYLMIVFLQVDMRIRWVGPIIPPLVILSAHGLHNLIAKAKHIGKAPVRQGAMVGIGIAVIAGFGLNAEYLQGLFQKVDAVSYLNGNISRTDYIQHRRPEYAAIEFINQNLPADARVLAIFLGKRRYYFDRDVYFVNQLHWTTRLSSNIEGLERLRQSGFTHIIVRYDLFNSAMQRQLTADQAGWLVKFFNEHATLLFRRDGYGVYKL